MNIKILIGAIVVIILLPVVYIFSGLYTPAPTFAFRGLTIAPIEPSQGVITLPTIAEDEAGATMRAVFKPGFIERITGVKPPNPQGLDLTIDSYSEEISSCAEGGKIPPRAEFKVAAKCAEQDFASWQAEKKTALFVDADQKLIVFGASGNNMARVYHNGMIASYISPDMLQSDRKREACIIGFMLDNMIGFPPKGDPVCGAIK
jgi:hypothetical protein